MKKHTLFFIFFSIAIFINLSTKAQEKYKTFTADDSLQFYKNTQFHQAVKLKKTTFVYGAKPKNIILFIGDGMGTDHVFAAYTANKGVLNIMNMPFVGFSKTQAANNYITDSAAGGTAIACGQKTKNGAIGVDAKGNTIKNICEYAKEKQLSTGLISTSAITHATPASFIAHQLSRRMYEDIAADFLQINIDLFIGGGLKFFDKRTDKRVLTNELKEKGYQIAFSTADMMKITKTPMAVLLDSGHLDRVSEGIVFLSKAVKKSTQLLSKNKKGFFLMVEGSQIDWGAHQNNTSYIIEELLDMDKAVGGALKFAEKNKETLVVVTSDHETGGMAINDGNIQTGEVYGRYTSSRHTATMVPVFAYGPGAELFSGVYENTELFQKIILLLNLK